MLLGGPEGKRDTSVSDMSPRWLAAAEAAVRAVADSCMYVVQEAAPSPLSGEELRRLDGLIVGACIRSAQLACKDGRLDREWWLQLRSQIVFRGTDGAYMQLLSDHLAGDGVPEQVTPSVVPELDEATAFLSTLPHILADDLAYATAKRSGPLAQLGRSAGLRGIWIRATATTGLPDISPDQLRNQVRLLLRSFKDDVRESLPLISPESVELPPMAQSWHDEERARTSPLLLILGPQGVGKTLHLGREAVRTCQSAIEALDAGERLETLTLPLLNRCDEVAWEFEAEHIHDGPRVLGQASLLASLRRMEHSGHRLPPAVLQWLTGHVQRRGARVLIDAVDEASVEASARILRAADAWVAGSRAHSYSRRRRLPMRRQVILAGQEGAWLMARPVQHLDRVVLTAVKLNSPNTARSWLHHVEERWGSSLTQESDHVQANDDSTITTDVRVYEQLARLQASIAPRAVVEDPRAAVPHLNSAIAAAAMEPEGWRHHLTRQDLIAQSPVEAGGLPPASSQPLVQLHALLAAKLLLTRGSAVSDEPTYLPSHSLFSEHVVAAHLGAHGITGSPLRMQTGVWRRPPWDRVWALIPEYSTEVSQAIVDELLSRNVDPMHEALLTASTVLGALASVAPHVDVQERVYETAQRLTTLCYSPMAKQGWEGLRRMSRVLPPPTIAWIARVAEDDPAPSSRISALQALQDRHEESVTDTLIRAAHDDLTVVKLASLEGLARRQGARVCAALLEARETWRDLDVHHVATAGLARQDADDLARALVTDMPSEEHRRHNRIRTLSELTGGLASELLVALTQAGPSMDRITAVKGLAKRPPTEGTPALLQALAGNDQEVRLAVADALRKRPEGDIAWALAHLFDLDGGDVALTILESTLEAVTPHPGSPGVAEGGHASGLARAVAEVLGARATAQTIAALIPALSHEHAGLRWLAALAFVGPLGSRLLEVAERQPPVGPEVPHVESLVGLVGRELAALAEDDEPAVRHAAARALVQWTQPGLDPSLISAYLRDEDPAVRQVVVSCLGDHDESTATGLLLSLVTDPDVAVREATLEALSGRTGEAVAVAVLAAARDPAPSVRTAAVRALTSLVIDSVTGPSVAPDVLCQLKSRRAAGEALNDRHMASVIAALLTAAGDEDNGVRFSAVSGLAVCSPIEAMPTLLIGLQDQSRSVRRAAVEALAATPGDSVSVALVLALKGEADPWVRAGLIDALGVRAGAFVTQQIAAWAGDPAAPARALAVKVLIQREGSDVTDALAEALISAVNSPASWQSPSEPPHSIQKSLVIALARRHGSVALTALEAAARRRGSPVRLEAVEALAGMPGSGSLELVLGSLHDHDPYVRGRALLGLENRVCEEGVFLAILAATCDEDPSVRGLALEALATASEALPESSDEALMTAVDDEDSRVRATAVRLLAGREGAATDALVRALADPDFHVRFEAVQALRGRTESIVTAAMVQALADEHPVITKLLIEVLADRPGVGVTVAILDVLEKGDGDTRLAAVRASSFRGSPMVADALLRRLGADSEELQREVLQSPAQHTLGHSSQTSDEKLRLEILQSLARQPLEHLGQTLFDALGTLDSAEQVRFCELLTASLPLRGTGEQPHMLEVLSALTSSLSVDPML